MTSTSTVTSKTTVAIAIAGLAIAVGVHLLPRLSFMISSWLTSFRHNLAKNARAPSGSLTGWLAAKLMQAGNTDNNQEMIDVLLERQRRAAFTAASTLVELGPGNGMSMEYLLSQSSPPETVIHGIEISERFRSLLQQKFSQQIQEGTLRIHGDDARDNFPASNVDAIYGANVVYFLTPLDSYLSVFYQHLQPGGMILFAVQEMAKGMGDPIFVNTDWDLVLEQMKHAGFTDIEQVESKRNPGKTYFLLGFK